MGELVESGSLGSGMRHLRLKPDVSSCHGHLGSTRLLFGALLADVEMG